MCLVAASLFIAACGGGGSSDSDSSSTTVSASATNGIYFGQGYEQGWGSFRIFALVDGGDLYAISETGVGYSGQLSLKDDSRFTTALNLYGNDNLKFDSASVTGRYTANTSISGDFSRSSGSSGDFTLEYSPESYETPVSLDLISGTWQVFNTTAETSVTFDENGTIFGTDSDGCVFSGTISVPHGNVNMFRVLLRIENCAEVNGRYDGLAMITPETSNTSMLVFVSNPSIGFVFDLER